MFCNECGNQIPAGADFCPVCGNKMRMAMPSPSPERKISYPPIYQMGAEAAAQQAQKIPSPASAQPVLIQPLAAQPAAVLNCLEGTHKGKTFPVQGEILIGSQQGQVHIILEDAYVSRKHLAVRFNSESGCYEVKDQSMNGTFLDNGTRLPKGAYASCPRGTVIYLGSSSQQFKLM